MSKQQRDFVTYVRNGVAMNALVAFSRDVYTPATQTVPASTVEHLTVVYLDPNVGGGVPTGEALRNSVKIQMDVPPMAEGLTNGWRDAITMPLGFGAAAAIALGVANAPSAADLDAVATEQKAKEATAGETPGFQRVADAASALQVAPEPVFETKEYADGSTATGVAPLPDQSPSEQEAAAAAQQVPGDPAAENQANSAPPTE